MIVDGVTQLLFSRESNNWLRFVTGLMAGISQVAFIDFFAESLSSSIYEMIV